MSTSVQVDMDGNLSTDLVVGAPGVIGCVYVLLGEPQHKVFLEWSPDVEALDGSQHVIEEVADLKICGEGFSRYVSHTR